MEEDGGGCGDDDNNACVAYDDRANENAMKASPEGGVQGVDANGLFDHIVAGL